MALTYPDKALGVFFILWVLVMILLLYEFFKKPEGT